MILKETGAILAVLVAVTILGHLWFHMVEALLGRVKRLFAGHEKQESWHPLPEEYEGKQKSCGEDRSET